MSCGANNPGAGVSGVGGVAGAGYHMPLTLEETLANLPYDAIQVQRALSNHSGMFAQIEWWGMKRARGEVGRGEK